MLPLLAFPFVLCVAVKFPSEMRVKMLSTNKITHIDYRQSYTRNQAESMIFVIIHVYWRFFRAYLWIPPTISLQFGAGKQPKAEICANQRTRVFALPLLRACRAETPRQTKGASAARSGRPQTLASHLAHACKVWRRDNTVPIDLRRRHLYADRGSPRPARKKRPSQPPRA